MTEQVEKPKKPRPDKGIKRGPYVVKYDPKVSHKKAVKTSISALVSISLTYCICYSLTRLGLPQEIINSMYVTLPPVIVYAIRRYTNIKKFKK